MKKFATIGFNIILLILLVFSAVFVLLRWEMQWQEPTGSPSDLEKILTAFHNPASRVVLVVSHRGTHLRAPENSLPSIRDAILLGADAVELDVRTTRDDSLVLMHDKTVDRTTDGTGRVRDLTFAEIRRLHLTKEVHGDSGAARVPTLREALLTAKGHLLVDIDWKDASARDLIRVVKETSTLDQVIFFSRNFSKLDSARILAPEALVMPRAKAAHEIDSILARFHPPVVHIDPSFYSLEVVQKLRSGRARIWINALGKPDLLQVFLGKKRTFGKLIAGGANMVQTDRPQAWLAYLRQIGRHW
jgi:glycerophosphoryl diester phosphodiesterase